MTFENLNQPEQKEFPVVCSRCKKEVGRSTVENSHGTCEECGKELWREYYKGKKK